MSKRATSKRSRIGDYKPTGPVTGKRGSQEPVEDPNSEKPDLKVVGGSDASKPLKRRGKVAKQGQSRHNRISTQNLRGILEFDDDKISEDIGPSHVGAKDHMTLSFAIEEPEQRKLNALAEARNEPPSSTARKILEHKIFKNPSPAHTMHRVRINFGASKQLRDAIDEAIEGTGMKRTEFLTLQLRDYLSQITIEDEPSP